MNFFKLKERKWKRPFVFSTVLSLWEKNSREDFHHLKKYMQKKKQKKK